MYAERNYSFYENPENGKAFFAPKTQKHVNNMIRACQILKDWSLYNYMIELTDAAFPDVKQQDEKMKK